MTVRGPDGLDESEVLPPPTERRPRSADTTPVLACRRRGRTPTGRRCAACTGPPQTCPLRPYRGHRTTPTAHRQVGYGRWLTGRSFCGVLSDAGVRCRAARHRKRPCRGPIFQLLDSGHCTRRRGAAGRSHLSGAPRGGHVSGEVQLLQAGDPEAALVALEQGPRGVAVLRARRPHGVHRPRGGPPRTRS
jgi:hypothetical protein